MAEAKFRVTLRTAHDEARKVALKAGYDEAGMRTHAVVELTESELNALRTKGPWLVRDPILPASDDTGSEVKKSVEASKARGEELRTSRQRKAALTKIAVEEGVEVSGKTEAAIRKELVSAGVDVDAKLGA